MQLHLRFNFVLALFLSLSTPKVAFSEVEICEAFSQAFNGSEEVSKIYIAGKCHFNAGELGRELWKLVGEGLETNALNVLLIKHRDLSNPFKFKSGVDPWAQLLIPMALAKGLTRYEDPKNGVSWSHHTVLEYKGMIMDPDFKGPTRPIAAKTYFTLMFPRSPFTVGHEGTLTPIQANVWSDLQLIKTPLAAYISRFPGGRPLNPSTEDLAFLLQGATEGVEDFLKRFSESYVANGLMGTAVGSQ